MVPVHNRPFLFRIGTPAFCTAASRSDGTISPWLNVSEIEADAFHIAIFEWILLIGVPLFPIAAGSMMCAMVGMEMNITLLP